MSEEKQLTVAEILARAQQENPDAGKRRRHRRSIEEGGVTVAELTGSLKKVEARPAEPKHSSVPIDGPEKPQEAQQPAVAEPTPAEWKAAEPKAAEPKVEAAEAKPRSTSTRIKVAPKPAPVPTPVEKDSSDDTAVIQKVEVAEEPVPVSASTPREPKAYAAAPVKEQDRVEEPVAPLVPEENDETALAAETSRVETADQGEFDPFDDAVPAEQIEVEEETINPIVLVLLIFLGVVAGILGFLMFQWVWANTGTAVAVGLAIVFVIAVLFGVRALRTGKDGLTMTMAGIAAAVAAFGPALL